MLHLADMPEIPAEFLGWFDVDLSDLGAKDAGSEPDTPDVRRSPRVPLYSRIELPWHDTRAIRARDISLGGLRALTRDDRIARHAGEKVHLRFRLPHDGQLIEASARVVAQSDAGNDLALGFRFETLAPDALLGIYRLVTARAA